MENWAAPENGESVANNSVVKGENRGKEDAYRVAGEIFPVILICEVGDGMAVEGGGATGFGQATEAVFDSAAGAPAVGRMVADGAEGAGVVSGGDGEGFAGEPVGGVSNGAGGVARHDHAEAAGGCGTGDVLQAGVLRRALRG